jgi:hypothetical protein
LSGGKEVPATTRWRKGDKVKSAAPTAITPGTVIATFTPAGTYPTRSEGQRHAAIYVSHSDAGVTVIDQWEAKTTPSQRTLGYAGDDSPRNVNKGDYYYVVEERDA